MELTNLINKCKKILNLNIAIVVLSIIIANNIYKSQARIRKSLIEKRDMEIKKNALFSDIKQSEEMINAYKNFLNQKDIDSVINTISNIAKEADIKITSLNPGAKGNYPVYSKYPFAISIEADDYHTIGKFISKLESHNDVYIVESLDMRPIEGPEAYKLMINLMLSTITFKD